jgi:hypothetical protein
VPSILKARVPNAKDYRLTGMNAIISSRKYAIIQSRLHICCDKIDVQKCDIIGGKLQRELGRAQELST